MSGYGSMLRAPKVRMPLGEPIEPAKVKVPITRE